MRHSPPVLRALLLSLGAVCLCWSPSLAAQGAVQASSKAATVRPITRAVTVPAAPSIQAETVERLLIALQIPGTAFAAARKFSSGPDQDSVNDYMEAHLSVQEIAHVMAPSYMPYLTTEHANQLIAAFEPPAGQKYIAFMRAQQAGKDAVLSRYVTAKEQHALREVVASAAMAELTSARKLGDPNAGNAFAELIGRRTAELMRQQMQALAGAVANQLEASGNAAPVLRIPAKTGITFVDKFTELIARSSHNMTTICWKTDEAIAALGMDDMLAPQSMVSAAALAHGHEMLDKREEIIAAMFRDIEAGAAVFAEGMMKLETPGKAGFQKGVKAGMEKQAAVRAKYREAQDAYLASAHALLNFAQANIGKLSLGDGKLLMERQEDVEAYRILGAKVDHDAEYIEQLRAEMIGRVRVVATGKTAKQ